MSQPSITLLSLFRKYSGKIKRAHPLELRAAQRSIPAGKNPLKAFFEAAAEYERERTNT